MVKLIVTDLDGTFLNSEGEAPPSFFPLYKQLKEKGILFCAASGRQFASIASHFAEIKDEMAIIAENGGIVWYKGELLFENALPREGVLKVIKAAAQVPDVVVMLCGKQYAYMRSDTDPYLELKARHYYSSVKMVSSLEGVEEPILKIAIYSKQKASEQLYPALMPLENELRVVVSGNNWVDVMNLNINKGEGLKILQRKTNILPSETMAFGDYHNDLEMITASKYSFAMQNAEPAIKQAAKYITQGTNNQAGVVLAIKDFFEL